MGAADSRDRAGDEESRVKMIASMCGLCDVQKQGGASMSPWQDRVAPTLFAGGDTRWQRPKDGERRGIDPRHSRPGEDGGGGARQLEWL